jgi:hypothetical protein
VKRFALILIAGAAFAIPSLASAGTSTIVKVDRASKLVAVTRANARVALVHTSAAARLHVGQRIALRARTLKNGTLGSAHVKVLGRAKTTRFRGFVLSRKHGRLVVSAGGAVISVRAGRTTATAANGGPTPGSEVQVDAKVDDDELEVQKVTVVSEAAPGGKLEGRLTIGTGTVTVRDDDMTLVLKVPTGFDLSKFKTGDEVLATFTQGADGSLTLTELAANDDENEADDEGEIEHGDDNGNNDDNDDGEEGDDD